MVTAAVTMISPLKLAIGCWSKLISTEPDAALLNEASNPLFAVVTAGEKGCPSRRAAKLARCNNEEVALELILTEFHGPKEPGIIKLKAAWPSGLKIPDKVGVGAAEAVASKLKV
ncbi:hypothetical protein WICPIJ_003313 [Wickerhamomyces pijperi]|uniref:Uncharacterized protein n=1 Tax=Wickerhamomyces pijperi TaxID=599730 RepID=A0A9P8TN45_WICPI|nr:hypothetical protein WICPIJ_003313 [Wickerhamomyces pijperi]